MHCVYPSGWKGSYKIFGYAHTVAVIFFQMQAGYCLGVHQYHDPLAKEKKSVRGQVYTVVSVWIMGWCIGVGGKMKNKRCSCVKCKLSAICLPLGREKFAHKCYRCSICGDSWYWFKSIEQKITHYNTCPAVIALIENTGICEPCYDGKVYKV